MNTYPLWKYLLILLAFLLCLVYSIANIYPPDYAIQIKADAAGTLIENTRGQAIKVLETAGIAYKSSEFVDQDLLIRLTSNADQLKAQALLKRHFITAGNDHIVALNLAPTTPSWLANIGGKPMKYGLDLSGGIHFLLEVDMDKAVINRLTQAQDEIRSLLRQDRIRYKTIVLNNEEILAKFRSIEARDKAVTLLKPALPEYQLKESDVSVDAVKTEPSIRITMTTTAKRALQTYAISQNLQSLRNRVNELGVSEPLVQRLGTNRIILDLPGIQDSAEAKRIIGKVANLEFRFAAKADASSLNTISFPYEGGSVLLEKSLITSGDRVANAQTGLDPDTNLPQVNITMDGQGGDMMAAATRNNVGRKMAIIFKETKTRIRYEKVNGEQIEHRSTYEENRIISLATVQAILASRFRITGLSQYEASDLALLLRAGALAAPMYIVEERTVGASLGEENIKNGTLSAVVGLFLVATFMLIYYRLFGLIANIALLANMVMLIAIMSLLGATLTLPGIVGIVLTIGMAVDANVLIFSRIKEELQKHPPQAAINSGFDRAFVTIVDANLTTLLVAIILYAVGTGPIKGFAITLSIGIMTSLFTSLLGTRAMVNLMFGNRNLKSLPI